MSLKEDLDFEISFYEGILEKEPNFVNALIALGDAYTKKGLYKEGLEIDQCFVGLKQNDSTVYYNLACSCSLLKLADSCLRALRKAIRLGFCDFSFMAKDPDLDFIRQDPRYKRLLGKQDKRTVQKDSFIS